MSRSAPSPPAADACPCGSGRTLSACCGRYHLSGPEPLQAPTAEALMRSRYSAYALNDMDYVQATWHAGTRPEEVESNEAGLRWLGLEVRRHTPIGADHATVEFVARSKWGGRACRLHETSRFVRENGQWFYVDGVVR